MAERERRARGPLPGPLRTFWVWSVGLTGLSFGFMLVMTYVFGLRYPYGLPYFLSSDEPFWDFTVFAERFQHVGQASFWDAWNYPFTYPAPMAVVFGVFYKLPHPLC